LDERTFLRCERCGKEKWPVSPAPIEKAMVVVDPSLCPTEALGR